MNEIIEVLTTKEYIIIYVIAIISCLISFLIYKYDTNKDRRRKKQNTKELNKLVDSISEEYEDYDYDYNQEPELVTIEPVNYDAKDALIENIAPKQDTIIEQMVNETITEEPIEEIKEKVVETPLMREVIEEKDEEFYEEEPVIIKKEEELQYTTIEPNKEEAKKELESLTEKLKQDEIKKEKFFNEAIDNIEEYETNQEKDAIISLDELNTKGKEIIESNEMNQYIEEEKAPISLKEFEEKINKNLSTIAENFEINKVADKPSQEEINNILEVEQPKKVKMDDFKSIKTTKYKPTPFISPIFGIEKDNKTNLELENTADYDKLDEEIRKTNEYIMTLQELQNNIK